MVKARARVTSLRTLLPPWLSLPPQSPPAAERGRVGEGRARAKTKARVRQAQQVRAGG